VNDLFVPIRFVVVFGFVFFVALVNAFFTALDALVKIEAAAFDTLVVLEVRPIC